MQHFSLLCIGTIITLCQSNEITYYEDIINSQINSSVNYILPTDASMYKPTKPEEINDFGTFDFIIIGAGSTGTVIANRLSEIGEWKILLLEAGVFGNNITAIPDIKRTLLFSDYNWGYKSTPQKTACLDMVNRQCVYPRGKGIGGSSLINGMVYARGHKLNFDKWAQLGNPGWSYDEILPYFKLSENFEKTDPDIVVDYEFHGKGGNVNVDYPMPRHPLITAWLNANKEKGYKVVDYNGEEELGVAVAQINTKHGRREDQGTTYIEPIKDRENVVISTESYVTKIIVCEKNKTVTGVQFTHKGRIYVAHAAKEVILSAGSIASPQILMLSGIGPSDHLQEVGIQPVHNLDVGRVLRDHPTFYGLAFDSNYTKTHQPLSQYVQDYLNGIGFLAAPDCNNGIGFHRTKYEKFGYPDLEFLMFPNDGFVDTLRKKLATAKEKFWEHLSQTQSFLIYIALLQPESVGNIKLRSNNPFDYPLINSNFLSDRKDQDRGRFYEGIKFVLDLLKAQTLAKINATLAKQNLPACDNKPYLSKSYWYCVLRYFTHNLYHPVGSCPMGPDPKRGAVVDAQCKVHGIKNLRVADASIFPLTLSGHPNAVCVLIGEKVSDFIKLQHL